MCTCKIFSLDCIKIKSSPTIPTIPLAAPFISSSIPSGKTRTSFQRATAMTLAITLTRAQNPCNIPFAAPAKPPLFDEKPAYIRRAKLFPGGAATAASPKGPINNAELLIVRFPIIRGRGHNFHPVLRPAGSVYTRAAAKNKGGAAAQRHVEAP